MATTHPIQRPYTADDLAAMPDDGRRYEIIGGELLVSPSPTRRHQVVSGNLHFSIHGHLKRTGAGLVIAAPFDVHLGEHDIVQPDILVVLEASMSRLQERGMVGPPDLVIEILSPSNAGIDRVRKAATYATFGVPEYWIVDPETETILAQTLDGGRFREITSDDGFVHSNRVDGLVIDLAEIFAVPEWLGADGEG